jgi:hypothetical protein
MNISTLTPDTIPDSFYKRLNGILADYNGRHYVNEFTDAATLVQAQRRESRLRVWIALNSPLTLADITDLGEAMGKAPDEYRLTPSGELVFDFDKT